MALAVAVACTMSISAGAQSTQTTQPTTPTDYSALARVRADSASRLYTAADVRFMSGMIGHHAQAIVMSRWAPTHGASSAVRTLAERIINAQQDEIATMRQWLRDRGQPVPDPGAGMMTDMPGMQHETLMPGMLTEAQMHKLDAARGTEFDRLFCC